MTSMSLDLTSNTRFLVKWSVSRVSTWHCTLQGQLNAYLFGIHVLRNTTKPMRSNFMLTNSESGKRACTTRSNECGLINHLLRITGSVAFKFHFAAIGKNDEHNDPLILKGTTAQRLKSTCIPHSTLFYGTSTHEILRRSVKVLQGQESIEDMIKS